MLVADALNRQCVQSVAGSLSESVELRGMLEDFQIWCGMMKSDI